MASTESITIETQDEPTQAELAPWVIILGTAIGALIVFLIARRWLWSRQHPRKEGHIVVDIAEPERSEHDAADNR